MARKNINIGVTPNDGTGDPVRTAFSKVNDNFTELYGEVDGIYGRGKEYTDLKFGDVESKLSQYDDKVDDLEQTVTDAFEDGKFDELEIATIKSQIQSIRAIRADLEERWKRVDRSEYLLDSNGVSLPERDQLTQAKAAFDSYHNELIDTINAAIADGKAEEHESDALEVLFNQYDIAIKDFSREMEEAIEFIASKVESEVERKAKEYTDQQTQSLNTETTELKDRLSSLEQNMDDIFDDGVITEAERRTLERELVKLESEKTDLDINYVSIYNNEHLPPTFKPALESAKNTFDVAFTALQNSIESTILDNEATEAEVQDIQVKLTTFSASIVTLTSEFRRALEGIETARITGLSDDLDNAKRIAEALDNKGLKTQVDGVNNIIVTGALEVGSVFERNAGVAGTVDGQDNDIRFYAGSNYANRRTAPFRVNHEGEVTMSKASIQSKGTTGQQSVTINNGVAVWSDSDGNKRIEIGFDLDTGVPVIKMYDELGNEVYNVGTQGIIYKRFIDESYTATNLYKIEENIPYDEEDIKGKIILKLVAEQVGLAPGEPPAVPGFGEFITYRVYMPDSAKTTAYLYNAGQNENADQNRQYEGIYLKNQNKTGSTIDDGWYCRFSGTIVYHGDVDIDGDGSYEHHNGQYSFDTNVFNVVDGVTVESSTQTVTVSGNALLLPTP